MISCECCGIFVDERAVEFVEDWMICQSCLGDYSDEEIEERISEKEENSND